MQYFPFRRLPLQILLSLSALTLAALACGEKQPDALETDPAAEASTPETLSCNFPQPDFSMPSQTRSFDLGFSRWPPAATQMAIERLNAFLIRHADMTLIHLDSGVPWPEALADEPFSSHVQNDWRSNKEAVPADHKLFVAITPLNNKRDGLAAYRGDKDNQALPSDWEDRSLDNPGVKQAYLNYALQAIEFFDPDFLAIGIEVNLTVNADPGLWDQYRRLHEHVYLALKTDYPDLPVFASFTYPDMKGNRDDSAPPEQHQAAVRELLAHTDLLGLSVYPYSYIYGGDGSLPADYFDLALSYNLPVAITESGMPSQEFTAFFVNYPFEVQHQTNYMKSMLQLANQHDFRFVINWAAIDFEELLQEIPIFMRDLARFWVYTGLETGPGCEKPALTIWDAYLQLPKR